MQFTLTRGQLQATVESHGGELVSLMDGQGTEYIWGGDPAYWSGRNPVLFPIVGRLKDDNVRIGEGTYHMARHGFARHQEFIPVEQAEDHIVLELRENADTLAQYPFPFSLQVCHRLTENGFSTAFRIKNIGGSVMPFCIGAHTAFRCPLSANQRFEDYEIVFPRPEKVDTILLTPEGLLRPRDRESWLVEQDRFTLDHAAFSRLDTIIFEGLRSSSVSLRHRESGQGVRMDFAGFPVIAFWTVGPFICLEPWHGCAGAIDESGLFQDKPHCIQLAPGEEKNLQYTVSIL